MALSAAQDAASPASPSTPSTFDMRNDRSERLWGSDGQKRLAEAHVLLLGASATGCEALKNMILPGLGRFTIVDDARVTQADLGRNFFAPHSSLGTPIAPAVCNSLKELNPFVEGHSFVRSIDDFVNSGGDGFLFGDVSDEHKNAPDPQAPRKAGFHRPSWNATHVIATSRMSLPTLLKLSQQLAVRNITLTYVACSGLLAYMRTMSPDMPVVDTAPGPDETYFDPRVIFPFPALKEIYEDLNPENEKMDQQVFSHLPWPAISYHAVKKWRSANNKADSDIPTMKDFIQLRSIIDELSKIRGADPNTGLTPATFADAKTNLYQILAFQRVSPEVKEILAAATARAAPRSSAFWVFMTGVKSFYEEHGYLPIGPSLPDFTTTTDVYTRMAKAFKAQHIAEAEDVFMRAVSFLKQEKRESNEHIHQKLHVDAARNICANIAGAQFLHYPSLEDEVGTKFDRPFVFPSSSPSSSPAASSTGGDAASPDCEHMRWRVKSNEGSGDDACDSASGWYAAIRACWSFQFHHHGQFPGHPQNELEIGDDSTKVEEATLRDAARMWAAGMCNSDSAVTLPHNVQLQVREMIRYGGSEMGHVAAIMGAVASQEIIKFIQHKRVPVTPWCIFDGNTSKFIQVECASS